MAIPYSFSSSFPSSYSLSSLHFQPSHKNLSRPHQACSHGISSVACTGDVRYDISEEGGGEKTSSP